MILAASRRTKRYSVSSSAATASTCGCDPQLPTNSFSSFTEILDASRMTCGSRSRWTRRLPASPGRSWAIRARLTNIEWDISAAEICARFGTARAGLLNDLEAMAHSTRVLADDELAVLQEGVARPTATQRSSPQAPASARRTFIA
jgi:glucokinase